MKNLVMAGMVISCLIQPAFGAGTWKNRAYDATYTMTNQMGPGTYRMAADGKGRALIETKAGGVGSTMIIDSVGGSCYSINSTPDGKKMAIKMPYKETNAPTTNEELRKMAGSRPLGVRVIAGHPAHGTAYTNSNGSGEAWIADDLDIMVQSSSGSTTMTLKSFSPVAPLSANFTVPAGVQVMDMNNLGSMYGK